MLGFAFLHDSLCATAVWLQICIAPVVEHWILKNSVEDSTKAQPMPQADLNKKAQKWNENEAPYTWFPNDYDRAAQAAQAELNQKALEADAKHELEQQQQRNAVFLRRMNQDILFLFKPKQ